MLVSNFDFWQELTLALGQHQERIVVDIEALPGVVDHEDVHSRVVVRDRPARSAERRTPRRALKSGDARVRGELEYPRVACHGMSSQVRVSISTGR